ncbi:MAG: hypothetical protein ACAF41_14505 [Leptolyngbya sp. BL-A-14]
MHCLKLGTFNRQTQATEKPFSAFSRLARFAKGIIRGRSVPASLTESDLTAVTG